MKIVSPRTNTISATYDCCYRLYLPTDVKLGILEISIYTTAAPSPAIILSKTASIGRLVAQVPLMMLPLGAVLELQLLDRFVLDTLDQLSPAAHEPGLTSCDPETLPSSGAWQN